MRDKTTNHRDQPEEEDDDGRRAHVNVLWRRTVLVFEEENENVMNVVINGRK